MHRNTWFFVIACMSTALTACAAPQSLPPQATATGHSFLLENQPTLARFDHTATPAPATLEDFFAGLSGAGGEMCVPAPAGAPQGNLPAGQSLPNSPEEWLIEPTRTPWPGWTPP